MKLIGTIVKTALSIAAMKLIRPDGLGSALVSFAAVYGFISWYVRSFTCGGIHGIGGSGLIIGFFVSLFLPALAMTIPLLILEAIFPGEIGTIIYGVCIIIAGAGCLVNDIRHICRALRYGCVG